MHAHDEHQVGAVEVWQDPLDVRLRVEGDAGTPSGGADRVEGGRDVRGGLDVHGHIGRAGIHEPSDPGLRPVDHEVDVQRQARRPPQVGHHLRPECEIRHEVPVHDVDVEPVRPTGLRRGGGVGQSSEIGGQDRRRELRRAQRVPLSRGSPAGIIDVASPAFSGEDLSYV